MAAPIAPACTYIGFLIGWVLGEGGRNMNMPLTVILLGVPVPLMMAFEYRGSTDELRSVTTSIEIGAYNILILRNLGLAI